MNSCKLIDHGDVVVYITKTLSNSYQISDRTGMDIVLWNGMELFDWIAGRSTLLHRGHSFNYNELAESERIDMLSALNVALLTARESGKWFEDMGWGGC